MELSWRLGCLLLLGILMMIVEKGHNLHLCNAKRKPEKTTATRMSFEFEPLEKESARNSLRTNKLSVYPQADWTSSGGRRIYLPLCYVSFKCFLTRPKSNLSSFFLLSCTSVKQLYWLQMLVSGSGFLNCVFSSNSLPLITEATIRNLIIL